MTLPRSRSYEIHFKIFLVTTESESEVAQSCPTLYDPMDCSLPGSSVHGIFQAIVLEWIAISFSRGYSQTRDWTQVSHIVDRHFTVWATREVQKSFSIYFSFLVPSFLSLYLLPTLFPPPIPSIYCTVELQCCVSFSFILYPEKKHLYFFSFFNLLKDSTFSFIDLCSCFLHLCFINFCSDLYDFFPSTNFGLRLFFRQLL